VSASKGALAVAWLPRRRVLNLRTKSNGELFRLFRVELALRYRGERSLKEAERVISKFEQSLGGYPPSVELAKSYLSGFRLRKPNTLARYTVLIGQFMKWYGEPLDIQIRQPKMLPQVTGLDEVVQVTDAMASRKTHKNKAERDILLVETARLTGLRRAELANLNIGDLDFVNLVVVVRSGKGLRDRSVPLVPSLSARLEAFCRGRDPGESVFGLKAVTISGKISTWAKKAGQPQIHAHSLRHQFGTELGRKGVSARVIQSLLGHSDLGVTQLYVDVVGKDLRDAVGVLDDTALPASTERKTETRGATSDSRQKNGLRDEAELGPHQRELFYFGQSLRDRLTLPTPEEVVRAVARGDRPAMWVGGPALNAFTQYPNVDGAKDKRRAASGNDIFSSVTSFTASSRNSFVYLPCGTPFILTPPSFYLT